MSTEPSKSRASSMRNSFATKLWTIQMIQADQTLSSPKECKKDKMNKIPTNFCRQTTFLQNKSTILVGGKKSELEKLIFAQSLFEKNR